jgi:hypothetical protein
VALMSSSKLTSLTMLPLPSTVHQSYKSRDYALPTQCDAILRLRLEASPEQQLRKS